MWSSRIFTAFPCASKPSTVARLITASPRPLRPAAVSSALVMCFTKVAKLTPEYCFAYPYVATTHKYCQFGPDKHKGIV